MAAEERFRSLVDEMNSVYVGLTRARDAMWIFLPHGAKRAANPLVPLFAQDRMSFGRLPRKESGRQEAPLSALPVVPIGLPRYGDWVPWLRDEFSDKGHLKKRAQIRRGEVLHALLSWVADAGEKTAAALWREIRDRARLQFPFVSDWTDYEATWKKIFAAPSLKPFFRPKGAEVLCEQEITYKNGQIGRIDRMIIKDDEVWVVDYKSSRQEAEEGRAQVQRYAQAVKSVFAKKLVRAFLIYLDTARAEDVS